jgi:hypothetical protein
MTVKYVLMMNSPKGDGKYQIDTWAEMDLKAHLQFLADFNKRLKESGEFAGVQGLTSPGQAKLVRANSDGTPNTDGVFPESKGFLAGYWIVDVESEQRASDPIGLGAGLVQSDEGIDQHGVSQAVDQCR